MSFESAKSSPIGLEQRDPGGDPDAFCLLDAGKEDIIGFGSGVVDRVEGGVDNSVAKGDRLKKRS